jgi:prevent-host-death family protein
MTRVNVHVAKSRLPELLDRVEQGEDVIITYRGKPTAKLVEYRPPTTRNYRSIIGCWKGKVDLSRFHEADEEIAREFGMID